MNERLISEATTEDLLTAWELNSKKTIALLEHCLLLRVEIYNSILPHKFSDEAFIESLENNLKQLKALQE